jgi:hypothetical protein
MAIAEIDLEFASTGWFESAHFKAYVLLVRGVLLKAKKPLATREIHAQLKASANNRYTADALEHLDVEHIGILPTRYKLREVNAVRKDWQGVAK